MTNLFLSITNHFIIFYLSIKLRFVSDFIIIRTFLFPVTQLIFLGLALGFLAKWTNDKLN